MVSTVAFSTEKLVRKATTPLFLWKHRITEVGKNLRRPLVPPPAERRLNDEVTPGCSAFNPVWSWKPAGIETAQPSCAGYSPPWLPSWSISFSFYQVNVLWVFLPATCGFLSSNALPNLKKIESVLPSSWINLIIVVIQAGWVGWTVLPVEIILLGRKDSMDR